MRVALLSFNASAQSAVGNQLVEKILAFTEMGAEVRLFVQSSQQLHPELRAYTHDMAHAQASGEDWEYLSRCDLVIAIYSQYYELLQLLPRLAGGKPRIVMHYHGVTPPHLWPQSSSEFLEQSVRQRGLAWCVDQVLTDSQFTRRELREATDFPDERMTTLALSIDTQRYQSEPRTRHLHESLRLPALASVMLYVGRLAANKRVPILVETLAKLHEDQPNLHAVLIGDDTDIYGDEARRCRILARDLGVADRLHILGQVDEAELVRAYRSADVLVIPSLHEGYCVPIVEAMAAGLPVIAARTSALPETVGSAGLTFVPDDSADLARQVNRVLGNVESGRCQPSDSEINSSARKGRVALVSFRFGPEIVGGAETSLRTLGRSLQENGLEVEVFTTCTRAESNWSNELPAGTVTLDGLTVHRHRIDPHDRRTHEELVARIVEADGNVSVETEQRYLAHSLHSASLIRALRERLHDFDAIIVGPYLFGLSADVAQAFPAQTLLVPCFHDEPLARLALWPRLYGRVGGILFHSREEQEYAQTRLGVNHPNSTLLGTSLEATPIAVVSQPTPRPYIVYAGRFSTQKNLPRLLDWAERFQCEHPGRLDFVFLGLGEFEFPSRSWLRVLGRVDEMQKQQVLAGALALVQLSEQESLSLVVLEAWLQARPVIVSSRCPVLVGQVERAQGGFAVDDYAAFADRLGHLLDHPEAATELGGKGRAYVLAEYASQESYVGHVKTAMENLRRPLRELMQNRGYERAAHRDRSRWRAEMERWVEGILEAPARPYREDIGIQPCQPEYRVAWGSRTALLPIRLFNWGTHAVAAQGPGRHGLAYEISELRTGRIVASRLTSPLPALLLPGQSLTAVLTLTTPADPGSYRLTVWTERKSDEPQFPHRVHIPLHVEGRETGGDSCTSGILDMAQRSLAEADRLGRLPCEYVDVSTGTLGWLKLKIKEKLLNNFKLKYVDVVSRQQSEVNIQLVQAVQQIGECCSALTQAVRGLQQRIDQLEDKLGRYQDHAPELENQGADALRSPQSRSRAV